MGTWAVTSGITRGLRDGKRIRMSMVATLTMVNLSFTNQPHLFRQPRMVYRTVGRNLVDEINQAVASLPKAGGDLFFCRSCTAATPDSR